MLGSSVFGEKGKSCSLISPIQRRVKSFMLTCGCHALWYQPQVVQLHKDVVSKDSEIENFPQTPDVFAKWKGELEMLCYEGDIIHFSYSWLHM
jgi:hypothetical protein